MADDVTAVVVDDHPVVRAGVAHWLSTAGIELVASGENPAVAWSGPGATASVVVLDLHLAGVTPATAELRRLVEDGRRVVVYSMRSDDEIALQCLEIGALSYLTKAEGADHLVQAVRAAAAGQSYTPRRSRARWRVTGRRPGPPCHRARPRSSSSGSSRSRRSSWRSG